jgi:hypothetical protein
MGVDLRNRSTFERSSIIVTDDAIVKLEHTYGDDRLKRAMFASLESLIIWRKLCWAQITVVALLVVMPGILILALNSELMILGAILLGIGLLLIVYYVYCGKYTIRLIRRGTTMEFSGVYRPGKVRKFRDKVIANAQRVQGGNPPV